MNDDEIIEDNILDLDSGAELENLDLGDEEKEELKELMEGYDIDVEKAVRVKELVDELGLDEDDAAELEELL